MLPLSTICLLDFELFPLFFVFHVTINIKVLLQAQVILVDVGPPV